MRKMTSDSNAVGEIASPQMVDARGGEKPKAHRGGANKKDWAGAVAVGEIATDDAEQIIETGGNREDGGSTGAARTELDGHRFEERAETIRDAEDDHADGEGRRGH